MDDSYDLCDFDDDSYATNGSSVRKKPRLCPKTVYLSCVNHKRQPSLAKPIGPQNGQQKERYTAEEEAVKESRIQLYAERVERRLDIWTGEPASFNTAYWNSLED